MVFQAFIDDSYSYGEGGVYVLAGHIASAEVWAAFSKDWKELLPLAPLDHRGRRNFKMSQMNQSAERLSNLVAFYRVIERHVPFSLYFYFRMDDLRRAKSRVHLPRGQIDWGSFDSNFVFAFSGLMGMFHKHKDRVDAILGSDEIIDFIFDNQSEKKQILAGWDEYIEYRSDDIRSWFGTSPRFEDDQKFLPLQAADFFAWYVRASIAKGLEPGHGTFFKWEVKRPIHCLSMTMNEDQIVRYLAESVEMQSGHAVIIDESSSEGQSS